MSKTRTPPEPSSASSAMNRALRQVFEQIRPVLVAEDHADLEARFGVALRIRHVQASSRRKYGTGAIGKLTQALALAQNTLYEYAKVAKCWPTREDLRRLQQEAKQAGLSLTWRHLIVLANAPLNEEQRGQLWSQTLEKQWNARRLRQAVIALGKEKISAMGHYSLDVEGALKQARRLRRKFAQIISAVAAGPLTPNDEAALIETHAYARSLEKIYYDLHCEIHSHTPQTTQTATNSVRTDKTATDG